MNDVRLPIVSGRFYRENKKDLELQIDTLMANTCVVVGEKAIVRALIVPHAGYVYSGEVAAWAYQQVASESKYNRVILIGSSHQLRFEGVSVCNKTSYRTPLGEVSVDTVIVEQLMEENEFINYIESAHSEEHSLEVQLPFLQNRLAAGFKIVPVIIGTHNMQVLESVACSLEKYFKDALFVVSTDFSHYPNYTDAKECDLETVRIIQKNDPYLLMEYVNNEKNVGVQGLLTPLCGWTSVVLFQLLSARKKDLEFKHLIYQNSGDKLNHDHSRVVGYNAIAVVEASEQFLSEKAQLKLLMRAHGVLQSYFEGKNNDDVEIDEELNVKSGAFVSVYVNGKLRGCLGSFHATMSLYRLVDKLVVDAAVKDGRFEPVSIDELDDLTIEISILSPLKQISGIDEIEIGRHGIYIRKGMCSGTLLPQVAVRNNWSAEEFVMYCSERKTGIGKMGWKDAELFVYEVSVVSDKK